MTKQQTNDQQQPTAASAWQKARVEGDLYPLPSGRVARLRQPPLGAAALAGIGIPNDIAERVTVGRMENPVQRPAKSDTERRRAMVDHAWTIQLGAALCFVEPRVQLDPAVAADYANGEISIADIEERDALAIWTEFYGGDAVELARFRQSYGAAQTAG